MADIASTDTQVRRFESKLFDLHQLLDNIEDFYELSFSDYPINSDEDEDLESLIQNLTDAFNSLNGTS